MQNELVQVLIEMVETGPDTIASYETLLVWGKILGKISALVSPYIAYALFMRSLDENRHRFPWLPSCANESNGQTVFEEFEEAFLVQPACELTSVTRALLGTYTGLLISLIGKTLTVQVICNIASQKCPRL